MQALFHTSIPRRRCGEGDPFFIIVMRLHRERATNEPKDRPTDPCDWMDEEMSGGGVVGGRAKTIIQLP